MKFNFNYLLTTILGIIVFTSSAFAQRGVVRDYASPLQPSPMPHRIYIGPAVGLNILGHSTDIPTFRNDVLCPHFKNASGMGFYGGLTFEYLFGDVATSSSSIIVRALYNTYPGSVTVVNETYPVRVPNGTTDNSTVENVLDIEYNAATFEVMYKINPIPHFGLGIVVGPAFDFILTKNRTHRFNLVSPNNAQFIRDRFENDVSFENNDRTAIIYDGEIEDASGIRLGLKAGVQYEILLGSRLYVVPALAYNFGITPLTSRYTWRVSPLQVGIDARFVF